MHATVQDLITQTVNAHPVVIFMKGSPEAPQCGFSAQTVDVLRQIGCPIEAVDVLQNDSIRQGIKAYTDWPTIPQVFVGGTFIGGCDILMEMHQRGELAPLIQQALDRHPAA